MGPNKPTDQVRPPQALKCSRPPRDQIEPPRDQVGPPLTQFGPASDQVEPLNLQYHFSGGGGVALYQFRPGFPTGLNGPALNPCFLSYPNLPTGVKSVTFSPRIVISHQ